MELIDSILEKFKTGEIPSEATFRELIENIYIDKIIDHSDLREKKVGIFINETGDKYDIFQKTLIFEAGSNSNDKFDIDYEVSADNLFSVKYFKLVNIYAIKDTELTNATIEKVTFINFSASSGKIAIKCYLKNAIDYKLFITFNFVKY